MSSQTMTSASQTPTDPRDRGGAHQPMLIARNLKKHFPIRGGLFGKTVNTVRAVDGVSFAVQKGETLGIVGESGCGKSTLARLLMSLIAIDDGEVIFDGEAVGERNGISVSEMRQNMQMVFQDSSSSLNPRMPIVDSIAFAPRAHGATVKASRDKAEELMAKVGMAPDQFAGRYPGELSGGQKQRANIARALALGPRMLILDEAVSALDKSVEAQVLNLLRQLKNELGLTYVFISHDLHVVRYISDRVLVMYLGEIVEIGKVDDVYETPKHPYTRALLASQLSLDPDERVTEAPITGDPPNPVSPPAGCRFHTRCPHAEAMCSMKVPSLAESSEHNVACHMYDPSSGHSGAGRDASIANPFKERT